MRVVVVGSKGQLGGAVVEEFAASHDVLAWDRAALDITDDRAVLEKIEQARPDALINCTGFNAVDAAEEQPVAALKVNAFAVRTMARGCATAGAAFVHYSSDFVFDGRIDRLLTEDDAPNPRSAYAISKLLGEWFTADAPRGYALRVESLFGTATSGGPNKGSVAAIINGLMAGRPVKVFADRTVTPTHVIDAARATRTLLETGAAPGIYHCVNSGSSTWLGFAEEAARLLGVEPQFEVVRFADVTLPAVRPQYCALSNQKLAAAGCTMPTWQNALERFVDSVRVTRA